MANIYYKKNIVIFSILFIMSCNSWSENNKKNITTFTMKTKESFIIYGINIKKLMNLEFMDIEKELNVKTEIDDETREIYIVIKKDLINKDITSSFKDRIDISYGQILDPDLYKKEKYLKIKPNLIFFTGVLNIKENSSSKNIIFDELEKILPNNDDSKKIIEGIKKRFMYGTYQEKAMMQINFDIENLPIANFIIQFLENEIHYSYEFSTLNEPYW